MLYIQETAAKVEVIYSRALKFTKLSKPSLNRIASVIRISATFIAREYNKKLDKKEPTALFREE
jgi:hypothetical protein